MVTREEIIKLAKLSKLYVSEEELDGVTQDMAKIIGFADEISRADVEDDDFDNINGLENVFREDVVTNGDGSEDTLKNAPEAQDNAFVVPKTII